MSMIVFKNVLIMLAYMAMGYALVKAKLASPDHSKTIASLLLYCGVPCMIFSSFDSIDYSPETASKLLYFFVVSMAAQLIFYFIAKLILGKKMQMGKYRILLLSSFLANTGFFGIPIVNAMFPTEPIVSAYCVVFSTAINIFTFTIGEYMITQDKKYSSFKRAICNPTVIPILITIPMFLLKIKLPTDVANLALTIKNLTAPLCMFVLGLRLASMSFKEIFGQPFAYLISGVKLIIYPIFIYAMVYFLPFDDVFKLTFIIAAGCPCASIILSLAEIHDVEQKTSAYALLISSILCVITLPLLSLLPI